MFTANSFKYFLYTVGMTTLVMSCSSQIQKYDYPPTTNTVEEINLLQHGLDVQQTNQADILAPESFNEAENHLKKARELQQKNAKSQDVLEELGYARAYAEQSRGISDKAEKAVPEIIEARQKALEAGAKKYHSDDLKSIDSDFLDVTKNFEKGEYEITAKDKFAIQQKYNNMELKSIKTAKLSETRSLIDGAIKLDAEDYAPRALDRAQGKLKNAQAAIETDRHNDSQITTAANEARDEAQKLVETIQVAKSTKPPTPEATAASIVEQKHKIARLDQKQQSQQKQLVQKDTQIRQGQEKNEELQTSKQFNDSLAAAQKRFEPDEADVYRQGDNILIRMKSIKFSSGRADLPADSMASLSKAKELIKDMNAEKVVIEGHTDSIGAQAANKSLSQKRADAVAKYLASDDAIDKQIVEAKGYGDEKPLTTNKTKDGRAENRRVDIIITPSAM